MKRPNAVTRPASFYIYLRVCGGLMPSMALIHEESQQLAGRDTEHALLRVKSQVHLAQDREGLLQVLD